MATYLGTSAVFQANAAATAGNLGGSGFNPANTNFPTDGVIAGGTGNAATLTPTSSYVPITGDVGAMAYFPIQTGVTAQSWFPIANVAGGVITLNTAIGAGLQFINNRFVPNATAGVASTATPTLTYGIDYSRLTAARYTAATASGTTTAFTDTTNVPGKNWVGNLICVSTGTGETAGWYECVSETGGTVTLDRTLGTTYTGVTYYLGGAVSLGGSTSGITDVIWFALGNNATTSGCRFFIKSGTYTLLATINTLVGNASWPVFIEGYYQVNGDRPSIASGNQPVINMVNSASGVFNQTQFSQIWCITFIAGNATNAFFNVGYTTGGSFLINCKVVSKSLSANQGAVSVYSGNSANGGGCIGCEVVAYAGPAISAGQSSCIVVGNYVHDSQVGIQLTASCQFVANNLVLSCTEYDIYAVGGTGSIVYNNTVYGTESPSNIGVYRPLTSIFLNNILYGNASGYGGTGTGHIGYSDFNCFYNNTANIAATLSGAFFGANDVTATNPSFTSVSQVTGTTATSSTTILTDSGKNFTTAGVVAGRDYLHVVSATGATVGVYGITVVGTTTMTTDNTIGTGSAITYYITINRNMLPAGVI